MRLAAQLERTDSIGTSFQLIAIHVDIAFAHTVDIYLYCLTMQVGDFYSADAVYFETDTSSSVGAER